MLIPAYTFRLRGIIRDIELWFLKPKIHRRRTLSVRVSLHGMLRLIRVDTLYRVHNVGFLAGGLKYACCQCLFKSKPLKLTLLFIINYNEKQLLSISFFSWCRQHVLLLQETSGPEDGSVLIRYIHSLLDTTHINFNLLLILLLQRSSKGINIRGKG